MKISLQFLLFISLVSYTFADLPVHCQRSQIIGKWILETTANIQTKDGRVSCGHESPDQASSSYKAYIDSFTVKNSIKVILNEDYSVVHDVETEKGVWNMIYDEGFEIVYKGVKYFAFSDYTYNERKPDNSISHCDRTVIGWYYEEATQQKGCYRGHKEDIDDKKEIIQLMDGDDDGSKGQNPIYHEKRHKTNAQKKVLENSIVMIQRNHEKILKELNSKEKSWEAELNPMFSGMSFSEMNKFAGRKKHKGDGQKDLYRHYSREKVDDLPKELKWTTLIILIAYI